VQAFQRRRRPRASPPPRVLVALALLVVVAGVAWFLLRSGPDPETRAPAPVAEFPEPAPPDLPDVPPLDLPELGASDALVRELVARLSAHPRLAAWLATDRLIERFVLVVVDLAGGFNPAANLPHMAPAEPFAVRESDGRLVIAPESHRRYDLLGAVVASLDTEGTVRLYLQLLPLIEEAFQELGIPDRTFSETLELALRNVLAVEVPAGPLEVVAGEGIMYEFRDAGLEARRGAEKALIRMGPENARRIQDKAGELAEGLGIRIP
jgi:hypothetical protein